MKGYTLIEIMLVSVIIVVVLTGVLSLQIWSSGVQASARHASRVLALMRTEMEEIKETARMSTPARNFDTIIPTYNNTDVSFAPLNLNGIMHINASQANLAGGGGAEANLIDIRIVAGWVETNGNIIGEGIRGGAGNFQFQDTNGNGQFDSPYVLISAVARR